MKAKYCGWLVFLTASVTVLPAAFAPGGSAYTKRIETALLAEPSMLADRVATIGYAKPLKIEALNGAWLRVTDGKNTGWVFSGNLAEEEPGESRGADGLPIAASETSSAAAARPLLPATEDYSSRHGLGKSVEDLTWLREQVGKISADDVKAFLQEKKKGEYQ